MACTSGIVRRILQTLGRLNREKVESPNGIKLPAPRCSKVGHDVLDDRKKRLQLLGRTVEVVGRQQPERDHLDAGFLAPTQKRRDVVSPRLVSLCGVGAVGLGPVSYTHLRAHE